MTDFTEEELYLLGQALDCYYYHGNPPGQQAAKDLLKKVTDKYTESLGLDPPIDVRELQVGRFYRVVSKDGHRLDGKRVKLERILPGVNGIGGLKSVRTWVIDGVLAVCEVPSSTLVPCD